MRSVSWVTRPLLEEHWSDSQLRKMSPSDKKAAARLMFCGSDILCTTPSTLPELKPICIGGGAVYLGRFDGWPSPSSSAAGASMAARFLAWASFFWCSSSHNSSCRSARLYAAMRPLVCVAPGWRTMAHGMGKIGKDFVAHKTEVGARNAAVQVSANNTQERGTLKAWLTREQ